MTSKVQAEKAIKISKGNISRFTRQMNVKNDLESRKCNSTIAENDICDMEYTLEISFWTAVKKMTNV